MIMKVNRFLVLTAVSIVIIGIWTVAPNLAQAITPVPTITPTQLTATAVSPTQINLSWVAPSQNYGKIIIGYKIEQRLSTGAYYTIIENTVNPIPTHSLTGLTTGNTYTYRVSAVYSDYTTTDPSNSASSTPTLTSTPPPTPPPSSPITNVKFDFTPTDGTTLTGVIITQYDYQLLQYKKDPRSMISNAVPTSEDVTDDLAGVIAFQNNHLSPDTIPGPLIAKAVSPTQINLSWSAPSENYGAIIIGYKIEWKQVPGEYVVIDDNTGNNTAKYSIIGLTTGTTYTYRVSAIYSTHTTSNPSNEASATPLEALSSAPQSSPPQSTIPPSHGSTQPSTTPQPVINVKFDFTPSDGAKLSGVVLSQSDYQQLLIIKDPRSIVSNVSQTSATANNSLAALLRYQNIHTPVQSTVGEKQPFNNTAPPTQSPNDDTSKVFYGVLTSVIAFGIVGIVSWFVKTKITKKILKDHYFTLDKSPIADVSQVRIRNSGPIIEDCIILCGNESCVWIDTNLDKPRHIYEGSISTVKLPNDTENTNPMITVKSGKKILKKIRLDEISHG